MDHMQRARAVAAIAVDFPERPTSADILLLLARAYDAGYYAGARAELTALDSLLNKVTDSTPRLQS